MYVPALSERSRRRAAAYARNIRGDEMRPACSSESTAVVHVELDGMVTRTVPFFGASRHAAPSTSVAAHAKAPSWRLTWKRKGMLQEHGGRQGIDIALAATGGSAELADG